MITTTVCHRARSSVQSKWTMQHTCINWYFIFYSTCTKACRLLWDSVKTRRYDCVARSDKLVARSYLDLIL